MNDWKMQLKLVMKENESFIEWKINYIDKQVHPKCLKVSKIKITTFYLYLMIRNVKVTWEFSMEFSCRYSIVRVF
jgi:hypothetical protein